MADELKTFLRLAIVLLFWAALTLPFYVAIIGFRKVLNSPTRQEKFFIISDVFWKSQSMVSAGLAGAIAALWCRTTSSPFSVVFAALVGSFGLHSYGLFGVLVPAGFEADVKRQPAIGVVFIFTCALFFAFMYGLVGWIEGFFDPLAKANFIWTVVISLAVVVGLMAVITSTIRASWTFVTSLAVVVGLVAAITTIIVNWQKIALR